jgi:1-deoxyxylulose-5-phosphate synthase
LALLKVLRTVNANWIIAALPQRVPVTCQGSRAARCAPRGVEGTIAVKYVNLGSAGLRVSRICLGMMSYGDNTDRAWAQGEDVAEPIVRAAVDGGVTFFDTADAYNGGTSEVITGRLLAKMFASRDDYVLATKVYFPTGAGENDRGLSRKHILSAIDASLRRLGTDYVDLYQIHRWDPGTPAEETMQALNDVVRAGKARYVGASSMFAWQFAKAQYTAQRNGWSSFSSMQDHYNLIYREEEREMIPQCLDQGVAVLPWSPLARGLLAGSRTRAGQQRTTRAGSDPFLDSLYNHPADFDVVERVAEVAAGRGVPPAQVALAWLLHKPGVTAPIVGATRLSHLQDALAAEHLTLSEEEMRRLEEPYVPHPVLGHS